MYHLTEDPNELKNLFTYRGYGDLIASMRQDMEDWYSRYVDPRLDGAKLPVTGLGQVNRADAKVAFTYRYTEVPPPLK